MESRENNNHQNHSGKTSEKRKATHGLPPVSLDERGEGLPYAPVDWPETGDVWGWRGGKRITGNGFHKDRYLYLPARLAKLEKTNRREIRFKSLVSVERYIRVTFPGADVATFLDSFSWKMRAKEPPFSNTCQKSDFNLYDVLMEDVPELSDSDSESNSMTCKAGNSNCCSLLTEADKCTSALSPCDLCCSEPRFCRSCCCVLCCKRLDPKYEGYSYIKCEATMSDHYVCGHISHLNCALQCYMAGTVGGDIGLDAEYYCRRCDARTDLIPHVERMLKACESVESSEEIERVLKLGIFILCGSEKTKAKMLVKHIESVVTQLKNGVSREDIWATEKGKSAISAVDNDHDIVELRLVKHEPPLEVSSVSSRDCWNKCLELEYEIDNVLQELRESQEVEYRTAQQKLTALKNHLRSLSQQIEISGNDPGTGLIDILDSVDQIKQQIRKVKEMGEVALGFGRTRSRILMAHFDIMPIED